MATELIADCPPLKSPNSRPYRKRALTQAIELQEEAYQYAISEDTPIKERAAFMRAWCDLTEERRKLEMRPLPKPIDVTKALRPARVRQLKSSFEEVPPTPTTPQPGAGNTTGSVGQEQAKP